MKFKRKQCASLELSAAYNKLQKDNAELQNELGKAQYNLQRELMRKQDLEHILQRFDVLLRKYEG